MFRVLVTEFLLQVLCQSTGTMTIWVIRGDGGVGDFPGIQGVQGESVGSAQLILDWHKNSDLGSEVDIGTSLNSTTCRLIESVVLLTKQIGIITPLILSIVVSVALRLILYKSSRQIVSYKRTTQDHIVQEISLRSYRTWALMWGGTGNGNEAVQCICEVKWSPNVTNSTVL